MNSAARSTPSVRVNLSGTAASAVAETPVTCRRSSAVCPVSPNVVSGGAMVPWSRPSMNRSGWRNGASVEWRRTSTTASPSRAGATVAALIERLRLDFSQLATSRTFSTSPPAAFGGGSDQVISQSIGSEALCAFLTATFGRLPQRIGRDNDAQERHGLSCKVNALRPFGKTISEQTSHFIPW